MSESTPPKKKSTRLSSDDQPDFQTIRLSPEELRLFLKDILNDPSKVAFVIVGQIDPTSPSPGKVTLGLFKETISVKQTNSRRRKDEKDRQVDVSVLVKDHE